MPPPPSLAIVIAAGGDGRRMGGAKTQRMLGGQTLLERAADWAMRRDAPCAIAVRAAEQIGDSAAHPLSLRLPLLIDEHPGIGPVSALLSAMRFARHATCDTVMLIGCDQPFLPDALPARLARELGGHEVAMPVSRGKDQPMASLWRVNAPAVSAFIARGGRSLWRLADELGAARVIWPENPDNPALAPDPFANINDPATLEHFRALWDRSAAPEPQ